MKYEEFLKTKSWTVAPSGFEVGAMHDSLFAFQRDLVQWAIRQGRAALFADTGMGKTAMQLEWARHVSARAGDVLILAPLAVAAQTVREGERIGVDVSLCRNESDVRPGINITNYDRLHRFDPTRYAGVVLDESSIIKHHEAKTLKVLLDAFRATPYKLCATATPSPNDFSELGTHAEFLGICTQAEMLSEFFINDAADTGTWRLKGHAKKVFWQWVASWGALIRKPSDLGYDDAGYALPPLEIVHHKIAVHTDTLRKMGVLFAEEAKDLSERRDARKASVDDRLRLCAATINAEPNEQWIAWGGLNAETQGLTALIPDAVEVAGPDDPEVKERNMLAFAAGELRVLVSKTSICGFGLNFQKCARMAFIGVSDSWESYYQAVRRCYRFGQKRPVIVHVFASEAEGSVVDNLKRKERDAALMADELSRETREIVKANIRKESRRRDAFEPNQKMKIPTWMEVR